MKASEGKIGRVFFIHLEEGDDAAKCIETFAFEKGIHTGQIFVAAGQGMCGIIASDAQGKPSLYFPDGAGLGASAVEDIVIQEVLGVNFQRVKDPGTGRDLLERIASSKTRVLEKPAPAPEEDGPGTIPVYLFNAEFN